MAEGRLAFVLPTTADEGPEMGSDRSTSMTLLDRIRSGDPDAWVRTLALYRPLVVYWCRRGGAGEESEDLAQEVFSAVAAGIAGFRRERSGDSFRGWLRGVTRNKLADLHRRRGRDVAEAQGGTAHGQVLSEQADPLADTDPDEQTRERLEVEAVYLRALELVRDEFEERTWRAFWRVAVEGHDTAAVARDLGVTTAAIRLAKSRVLRRLKQTVGDLVE
jgi:RNA polymerase sigma-70 factor (ECF subfamily)